MSADALSKIYHNPKDPGSLGGYYNKVTTVLLVQVSPIEEQ